ncbi:8-amino-7-oxononanoate synthase [Allopusillimonas ginsengisoli]|uniref:8-amino-7-oxononanoate synthase n=1 Tax=Allopusillimonas ginsengisoli TaxID=453575 RepID=UPI00101F5949|nr:8-amino-7-oxononanoate synthase [Allopusillimonas ginsengisoli]TEA71876.1 8-amino-7-oxononanoate synthase [Allopusillimonas ginsengisoli]
MSRMDPLFSHYLDDARRRHVLRRMRLMQPVGAGRVQVADRCFINFSSNDYLGLSQHPDVIARAQEYAARYGAGAQASRLVCGTSEMYAAVEAKLARAKGTEAALLFASGWQANAAVLPALLKLTGQGAASPQVFTDKLVHASLHQGCAAAGVKQIRFRHNDLDHLESLLQAREGTGGQRFIVTESVFSMDGDCVDVYRLAQIAQRHDAFVYLDEAHATGVLGPGGMGLSGFAPGKIDLIMGTCSKALGGFGAYVAGSRALCDYLANTCSGFIYTTALPPAVLGALDAALDLVPTMDTARVQLMANADYLRVGLQALGLETGASSTHIVPAVVGDAQQAMSLSARLETRGMLVTAIRPPTVPQGTSRLRIALSAAHTRADITSLLDALSVSLSRQETADA